MTDLVKYPVTGFNSWLNEDDAAEYFETRLNCAEWDAAGSDDQISALLMAFNALDELTFDIEWNNARTLSDSYTTEQKADILEALQRAQCEQALHELRFDLDGPDVGAITLGGLVSVKFPNGQKSPPRYSPRAMGILRPLIKARSVSRFR